MNYEAFFTLLSKGECDGAEELRLKYIPNKLYKYISLDGTKLDKMKLNSLKENSLWLSGVKSLNDPYEFKGISLDRKRFLESGWPPILVDKFEGLFDFRDIGVSCLSATDYSSPPMWAYYSNNSRGFCIEYNVIKKSCVHEVMYEAEKVKVASMIAEAYNLSTKIQNGDVFATNRGKAIAYTLMQGMYMKDISWQHEHEYRIVQPIKEKSGENIEISNLGLAISKIVVGINCMEKNKRKINTISNKLGIGNIYEAITSDVSYGLKIKRME